MVGKALGLIETVGLAAAVEAADAAVKAANIHLIGYELTRGGGLVTVKLYGDVGAVQAAVQAGQMAANKINKVWSTHVIPRPHSDLHFIAETIETPNLPTAIDPVNDQEVETASQLEESKNIAETKNRRTGIIMEPESGRT